MIICKKKKNSFLNKFTEEKQNFIQLIKKENSLKVGKANRHQFIQ